MGRPAIFDQPMTPAERMRRHRARKQAPKPNGATSTVRDIASMTGSSVRYMHYLGAFFRHHKIKWEDDVINGRYGKIGMAFLAEVCRPGDADVQQVIHDTIKHQGAAAARRVWRIAKAGTFDETIAATEA